MYEQPFSFGSLVKLASRAKDGIAPRNHHKKTLKEEESLQLMVRYENKV